MLFSIIIPTRNEEGCIKESVSGLERVLSDASIPHEIIVVDDGSTDNTAKIVGQIENINASELDHDCVPPARKVLNELDGLGTSIAYS